MSIDPNLTSSEPNTAAEAPIWATLGLAELVEYVEVTHHRYLHLELPRLAALASKVADVHGQSIPATLAVKAGFGALAADLAPHLMKEERVLFPMIRELAGAAASPTFHCGTLQNPIRMMSIEHDAAESLMADLRQAANNYQLPDDACGSLRDLYSSLDALETDTRLHIHIENTRLFPMAVALEAELAR